MTKTCSEGINVAKPMDNEGKDDRFSTKRSMITL